MKQLEGKVAVITGGTQGLGAATARHFANEGAAGLVICGRNQDKGEHVASSITTCPVRFVSADLAVPKACWSVVDTADRTFGRIDCLINAGATTARGGILDTTPELFDEIMAVNVKGPFFLMQAALKLMIREGIEGAIVNIGSMSAYCGQSYLTPYSTSKGAISTLTRNVAVSVLKHRIRVNALNIGWMQSDQEMALHATQGHDEYWFSDRAKSLPFGRLIQPEEVAKVIGFLCSTQSGLMTGEVVNFDQTIWGSSD